MSIFLGKTIFIVFIVVISMFVRGFIQKKIIRILGGVSVTPQVKRSWYLRDCWEPLGLLVVIWMAYQGQGIGWLRAIAMNPSRFRYPRLGVLFVAVTGPLVHAFLAVIAWLVHQFLSYDTYLFFQVNASLALFNLLPLYPLDGQKIFSALFPRKLALHLDFFALRFGVWPLFIWIVLELIIPVRGPVVAMIIKVTEWNSLLIQIPP